MATIGCEGGSNPAENYTTKDGEDPELVTLNAKIVESPGDASLFFQRGKWYYEREGYDEAILDLKKAIQLDSLQPAYFHLLADTYLDYFQSYQALKTMETAAGRFPENIQTLLKLSEFQFILKQHDASYQTIDQILRKDPQNSEAYFMMGMNLRDQGDTIRAINSFQSCVENDPDHVDAWIILGQLYTALGDPLALKYFDNAIRADTASMQALHAKADYFHTIGKPHEALDMYRTIVLKSPTYEDAYYNSGIIYMEMDSFQKAYDQFNILLNIAPIYIRAYYRRGLASELLGNLSEAKKDFQQALKMAPEYPEAKEALDRVGKNIQ